MCITQYSSLVAMPTSSGKQKPKEKCYIAQIEHYAYWGLTCVVIIMLINSATSGQDLIELNMAYSG